MHMVGHHHVVAAQEAGGVVVMEGVADDGGGLGRAQVAGAVAKVEFAEVAAGLVALEGAALLHGDSEIAATVFGFGESRGDVVGGEPGLAVVEAGFHHVAGDGVGQAEGVWVQSLG